MAWSQVVETQPEQLHAQVLANIFSGTESMHYAVSWSGGVKIGDIYLHIAPDPERKGGHRIHARVKDYGPFSLIYPVDDTFSCYVQGKMKLPYRYEVLQREGYGKETRRITWYDQYLRYVRYQKNDKEPRRYDLTGKVYNEFSAFIITRALNFAQEKEVVVPTFADKKRHEVRVSMVERKKQDSIFGRQEMIKVQPKMRFKGLYDKSGDTYLWLTDDMCRVPVVINAKIAVGSLVAELVEYHNDACPQLRVATTTK